MEISQYKNALESEIILEKFLDKLDLIISKDIFIEIDTHPDYDISSYAGDYGKEYFFTGEIELKDFFHSTINACLEVEKTALCDHATLEFIKDKCNIDTSFEGVAGALEYIYAQDDYEDKIDLLIESGISPGELDDYTLNSLKITGFDNKKVTINYMGSFFGDGLHISSEIFTVISVLNAKGITKNITQKELYKQLIAESYMLYKNGLFTLSYYIAFSALDNLINNYYSRLNANPKEKLYKKLKKSFKNEFSKISANDVEVYYFYKNKFNKHVNLRNSLFHGSIRNPISNITVKSILLMTMTFIISLEMKKENFDEIQLTINV